VTEKSLDGGWWDGNAASKASMASLPYGVDVLSLMLLLLLVLCCVVEWMVVGLSDVVVVVVEGGIHGRSNLKILKKKIKMTVKKR